MDYSSYRAFFKRGFTVRFTMSLRIHLPFVSLEKLFVRILTLGTIYVWLVFH